MGRYTVDVHTNSTASIESLWSLLADVTTWVRWSAFDDTRYRKEGKPAPHGVGAERAFRIGPFRSVDTVISFDPPTHLSYDYVGPLPMKDYRADVTLIPQNAGTQIVWHAEFSNTIPLSGPAVRLLLRKVFRDLSSGLAGAAESIPSVVPAAGRRGCRRLR